MKYASASKSKVVKLAIFSLLLLVLYCAAILASSYFCWKLNVFNYNAEIIFYIIWVSGVVISSLVFSAASSSKGWLNGIIGAAVFMSGAFLLNCLLCKGDAELLGFAFKLPLFILIAFICGIFGINFRR